MQRKLLNRKSPRLKDHDYSQPGFYFVTICTHNHICYFGDIVNGKMVLNDCEKIAQNTWLDLPNHYANCSLDVFTVMPNHLHGIIIITPVGNGLKPFPTKTHGLSEIIRGFKTFSSRKINELNKISFRWQKSFYDHTVRKDESLDKIREYITNNPLKWELDKNKEENIWM